MIEKQRTLKHPAQVSGRGLHTGASVTATFLPAPVSTGVRFVRADLPGKPVIPADIEHVVDIARETTIGVNGAVVHTVEHLMASLMGLHVDNVIVEIDGPEPPVGDGSALIYLEALKAAGFEAQDSPRDYVVIEEAIKVDDVKNGGVELVVLPSDGFRVTFMMDYPNAPFGTQYAAMYSLDEFESDFAPARTFCMLSEVEELHKRGLIKGGGIDCAVVVADREFDQAELDRLATLFGVEGQVYIGQNGTLNGTALRFANEFCRHKTLDLIGDLSLLGAPLRGHVMAARSGHAANIELVSKIRKMHLKRQIASKYQLPVGKRYFFDVNAIQQIMPHRFPFLMVDRILDLVPGERVVGIKNVSVNEGYFAGHFPGEPVMPAVLQIEAMAQTGGLLMLNAEERPQDKVVYFMGVDKARFRKPVVPGDQLRLELELIRRRGNIYKMQGKAYVGNDLTCEAMMTAMTVDRREKRIKDNESGRRL
jgi:UDP-3-O-[3-hydroxymyristoyl] N-acetylglucosamine deacetylase/3-hydroxyacyl-[acyl-carrier-protein] dehydratase